MKNLLFCLLGLVVTQNMYAQKQIMVGFYNQENLFDTIDDPTKLDEEFLPNAKKQWNTQKYTQKLTQLSKVIASMNNGKGPDVLGLCEVENEAVVKDLVSTKSLAGFKYGVVHAESPDDRSIDNALIYKKSMFKLVSFHPYRLTMDELPEFKTRDILMVKLMNNKKQEIIILVNHFPSRSGGQTETEPKRIAAAKLLRHIFDSIHVASPNMSVMAIGDFNDEPMDVSMHQILGATETTQTELHNTMFMQKLNGNGSHMYRNEWSMLDQIIVNRQMATCESSYCYAANSANIFKQDWMIEQEGKFKGSPLRTFGGNAYLNGYSDHLPVYILLETK